MGAFQRLFCGAIAGITSVTFTYPLDIVRTRLSIQSASFAGLEKAEKGKKLPGMWPTLAKMYKTEGGFSALYRGIIPTVTGVAPYVSCLVPCYLSLRCFKSNRDQGRPQLYGVRSGPRVFHAAGGEEPKCAGKTRSRCHLWCSSTNLHLPIVCDVLRSALEFCKQTADIYTVTSSAADSRSTPCLAWVTSTSPSLTPSESLSSMKALEVYTRASSPTC